MGLLSANTLEQRAACWSLATLMSITPNDTFQEFEKVSTSFYVGGWVCAVRTRNADSALGEISCVFSFLSFSNLANFRTAFCMIVYRRMMSR